MRTRNCKAHEIAFANLVWGKSCCIREHDRTCLESDLISLYPAILVKTLEEWIDMDEYSLRSRQNSFCLTPCSNHIDNNTYDVVALCEYLPVRSLDKCTYAYSWRDLHELGIHVLLQVIDKVTLYDEGYGLKKDGGGCILWTISTRRVFPNLQYWLFENHRKLLRESEDGARWLPSTTSVRWSFVGSSTGKLQTGKIPGGTMVQW